MVKWAVKPPDAAGTDRNSESPPCRSKRAPMIAEHLIWDDKKRFSRCLAGGPSAEAWSVSRLQISDARQSLAASLVIFWAFLGIRASAAHRATGRLAHGQSHTHPCFPPAGGRGRRARMSGRDGDRLAAIRSLTKSQLASLCFLFSNHQGDRGAGQFCELLDGTAGAGVDQSQQPDLNREVLAL